MRITQNVITNNLLRNYNNNLTKMNKLNMQMSTGKRINAPSDDPEGLVTAMRLRTKLQQNEQYKQNVTDAISWMDTADSALTNLDLVLQRARELVVQGSTDSNDEGSLKSIADEIRQLKETVGEIANTTLDDRFIFGGTHTMQQVYDNSGNLGQWKGNLNPVVYEIGERSTIEVNLDSKVFGVNLNEADPMQGSIFDTLDKIATDLENGNNDDLSETYLADLDRHVDNVLSFQSQVGAKYNRLEMVNNRLDDMEVSYKSVLSQTEDIDMAELIIELKNQENVYRASLSAGAKIIQPSLADFLR